MSGDTNVRDGRPIANGMSSWTRRYNWESFTNLFSKIHDLENVESCIAIGIGSGPVEILLMKCAMPNLKFLITVEPEIESQAQLKLALSVSLPDVQCQMIQSRVEDWTGPNEPMDAMIAVDILPYYLNASERAEIYQKCTTQWLKPGGKMVIINDEEESVYNRVSRLLWPKTYYEHTIQFLISELKSLGYCVEKKYRCHGETINVSNPEEEFFELFYTGIPNRSPVDHEIIRQTLEHVAPDGRGNYDWSLVIVSGLKN